MSDYIKREDAIKLACSDCEPYSCDKNCTLMQILKMTPVADVVERKRGDWIRVTEELGESWMCSECMEEFIPHDGMEEFASYAHFCPNCGADMRGES